MSARRSANGRAGDRKYLSVPLKVKTDAWVITVLRDPLSKTALKVLPDRLVSDYGRTYPLRDGVFDLRLLTASPGKFAAAWRAGQEAYERFMLSSCPPMPDYVQEREGVAEVYRHIPVTGRCLDVGGLDGRLRAFLEPGQEYLSIDPFLGIALNYRTSPELRHAYPFIDEPMNFICALAEHLPLTDHCFDTVHMRSVIDHFASPELALREAYRVLRSNGRLVLGTYVVGGRSGREPLRSRAKEVLRWALVTSGFKRYKDYHIWHPTYAELCALLTDCGFEIEQTQWQRSEHDRVCYILARRDAAASLKTAT